MNENQQPDERGNLPSASSAERIVRCPASVPRQRLAETAPDEFNAVPDEPTDAASFGTRVHAALSGDLKPEQLTTRELETFEAVREVYPILLAEIGFTNPKLFHVEQRLWVHNDRMEAIFSGRLDLVLTQSNEAAIVEYKSLTGAPTADKNWQLRAQAVCLQDDVGFDCGHLCVIQPNARPRMSHCAYTATDVASWRNTLLGALESAGFKDAPALPGTWCKYCKAKAGCVDHGAWVALAMADSKLTSLMNLEAKPCLLADYMESLQETWEAMNPAMRARRYLFLKMAKDLFGAVEAKVKFELTGNPQAYEGLLSLVPGAPVREVSDVRAARPLLPEMSDEEFWSCVGLNLGDAEVKFANAIQKLEGRKITKGCPEKLAIQFENALVNIMSRTPKSPSVKVDESIHAEISKQLS